MYGLPSAGCATCSHGRAPSRPAGALGAGVRRVASETSSAPGYEISATTTTSKVIRTRPITMRAASKTSRSERPTARRGLRSDRRRRWGCHAARRPKRESAAANGCRSRWRRAPTPRTGARADRAPGPWSPRDLPDRLEKTVDLGLGVVRRQARPNRARERFAPAGRHLSLHLRDVVPVHVQEVEDVRVGAKAAVADSDGPFVAQGRRDQAVVQPVDDEARQREAGAGRAGLQTTKHPHAGNAAQAGDHS